MAVTLEYIEALNCFNFQMAQGEGYIASAAKGNDIKVFTGYVERYQSQVKGKQDTVAILLSDIGVTVT